MISEEFHNFLVDLLTYMWIFKEQRLCSTPGQVLGKATLCKGKPRTLQAKSTFPRALKNCSPEVIDLCFLSLCSLPISKNKME